MSEKGYKDRKKVRGLLEDLKPPHLLFTQSRGVVRIFRPVVQPFVLSMLHARQDLALGCRIALQFISDDHARNVLRPYGQLPPKSFRSRLVASALNQAAVHSTVWI